MQHTRIEDSQPNAKFSFPFEFVSIGDQHPNKQPECVVSHAVIDTGRSVEFNFRPILSSHQSGENHLKSEDPAFQIKQVIE